MCRSLLALANPDAKLIQYWSGWNDMFGNTCARDQHLDRSMIFVARQLDRKGREHVSTLVLAQWREDPIMGGWGSRLEYLWWRLLSTGLVILMTRARDSERDLDADRSFNESESQLAQIEKNNKTGPRPTIAAAWAWIFILNLAGNSRFFIIRVGPKQGI
jgi:hypothetical protein